MPTSYAPPTDAGALETIAVRGAFARRLPALRACYGDALSIDPQVERRTTILVLAAADGHVQKVELVEGTGVPPGASGPVRPLVAREATYHCIVQEIKTWRFPPTAWAGDVPVDGPPIFVVRFNPTIDEQVPGVVTRSEIVSIISRRADGVTSCYQALLKRGAPSHNIQVMAGIVVADRRVRDVALEGGSADPLFATCLATDLRELDFSSVPMGELEIGFPFWFLLTDPKPAR